MKKKEPAKAEQFQMDTAPPRSMFRDKAKEVLDRYKGIATESIALSDFSPELLKLMNTFRNQDASDQPAELNERLRPPGDINNYLMIHIPQVKLRV